ncbi:MAG TPA: hypothetical protein VM243_10365 [Phycisphaerae bacterium]|nr:hypothetical protein [Phycisphaerae bacterium]
MVVGGGRLRAVWAVALMWTSAADAAWIVTEIPTPAGWTGDTEPFAINDDGVVCGIGDYVSEVSSIAFCYDGTTLTELPYLHPSPATYAFAWASAINSSGQIAGRSHGARGVDRAVIWDGGVITPIPYPADANTNGDMRAYSINDAGVAVGYYISTTTGAPAAFYYDGATHSLVSVLQAVGLGLNGLQSYADDVNNSGVLCGDARDGSGEYNFYTYDIVAGTATNLGRPFQFDGCHTAAINDAGHVIGRGRSTFTSPIHALLHDGAFQVLDDTVLVAQWSSDIANDGRVVGNADISENRWSWYTDGPGSGSMKPVDLPGWTRVSVSGINNWHAMVGYGRTTASPNYDRGYIVTPPPGDADHDGDLDLADFAELAGCVSGPVGGAGFVTPSEACLRTFDFTPGDGDVDLADVGRFQESFEGS